MKRIIMMVICSSMIINVLTMPQKAYSEELNLALGKDAFASSQYAATNSPSRVNDGNEGSCWSQGDEKLTGPKGGFEYIAVDLDGPYLIKNIAVRSRRDVDQSNSRGGWILQLSNDREFKNVVDVGKKPNSGEFKSDLEVNIELEEAYRYVRVVSKTYFVVAEIEVFGTKFNPNTKTKFADINEPNYKGPIQLTQFLGIMEGVSKTEYGMHKLITRAEAARTLLNLIKVEPIKPASQIFKDVPSEHWASGYIQMCESMGLISYGQYYRPEEYITIFEFVKMIDVALGYSLKIENSGGYSIGVMSVAQELNLLSGVKYTNYNDPLDKSNAALLIYNALKASVMKSDRLNTNGKISYTVGETLLESVYKMELYNGKVTANNVTNYLHPEKRSNEYIKINDVEYLDDSGELKYLLGMNVFYLIHKDEPKEILCSWKDERKNVISIIKSMDISEVSRRTITYFDNEGTKAKKYTLSETVDVIKNGTAYPNWNEADLKPANGYLQLLDNNGDGHIDIIFIQKPTIIVVDYVIAQKDDIIIGGINSEKLSITMPSILKVNRNGKDVDISDVKKLDLVFAYISDNFESLIIDAVSNTVNGKVEEKATDGVTIGGKVYEFSDYYKNEQSSMQPLVIGQESKCILDTDNNLYWIMDILWNDTGEEVGFIYKVACGNSISARPEFKIFTRKSSFENFYTASNVEVDGVRLSADNVRKKWETNSSYFVNKLVLYRINSDNEITSIDTEVYNIDREAEDKLKKKMPPFGLGEHFYHNSNAIFLKNRMIQPLNTSTVSFRIPYVNGFVSNDENLEKSFVASTAKIVFPDMYNIKDKCEFYGEDKYGYPSFVVRYVTYSSTVGGATAITDPNAKGVIVDKVTLAINNKGEETYVINGFDIATGAVRRNFVGTDITKFYDSYLVQQEHPGWLDNFNKKFLNIAAKNTDGSFADYTNYMHNISELKRGDIVIEETVNDSVSAIERVFDFGRGMIQDFATDDGSFYSLSNDNAAYASAGFKLIYGKADSIEDGIVQLGSTLKGGEYLKNLVPYANIVNMFVCDDNSINKYKSSSLPLYYGESNSRIVVYSSKGVNTALFVYNY